MRSLGGRARTAFDVLLYTTLPGLDAYTRGDVKTSTNSVFADFTYDFTPKLSLSAGGRYTWDTRNATIFKANYLGGVTQEFGGNPTPLGAAFDETQATAKDDFTIPKNWDRVYWEGKKVLQNLLDIDVPVIAAVNGPALVHSEYILTCDAVLASDNTVFQDLPHLTFGLVPGDGVHVLWPHVLGPVRSSIGSPP